MFKTKEILQNAKDYLSSENLMSKIEKYDNGDPRLIEASLEVAQSSKSILAGLYYDFKKPNNGLARKIKNKIIEKISNIVRNTVERPLITQQKFNEQTYFLLELLLEENKKLKAEIKNLKRNN